MTDSLSGVQQRILDFVTKYQRDHGSWPLLRQIADAAGLPTTGSVQYHIGRIALAGYPLPPRLDEREKHGELERPPGV